MVVVVVAAVSAAVVVVEEAKVAVAVVVGVAVVAVLLLLLVAVFGVAAVKPQSGQGIAKAGVDGSSVSDGGAEGRVVGGLR